MKLLILSSAVSAVAALQTLSQALQDIPACSRPALASAMNKEGCPTSNINTDTFDCIFNAHFASIVTDVSTSDIDSSCTADFANAWGTSKGIYLVGASASDLSAAVSVLASEVGGSSSSSSGTSTAAGTAASTAAVSTSATTTASSSTSNAAATAAPRAALLGFVAPAVAFGGIFL